MMTYRLTDHTTADCARHYRKEEEVENAWRIEPIKRLRKYLMAQGVWSDKKELVLLGEASREVEAAVAKYLSVGEPEIGSMFDYMYANMPAELKAQRTSAIEEHD